MKKTTPFKSAAAFETDMKKFANKFKMTLAEHSKRISDYFEISCYHMIIRYYENIGYKLDVQNLQGGKFKYKCSPIGLLKNFSYFKATKVFTEKQEDTVYLYHNATVQSAFDDKVFTTPDIVVSKTNFPEETTDYYLTKKRLSYISKEDLVTFCEAKNLLPFPELMIGFIGTVYELKPSCINGTIHNPKSEHIAPSLMMSGTFNKPTKRIRESLEQRYYVNLFDNLFNSAGEASVVSRACIKENATLGRKCTRGKTP